MDRYIPIDEDGFFVFDGRRVEDVHLGQKLLNNLKLTQRFSLSTSLNEQPAWVEAFDSPLVARHVRPKDAQSGVLSLAYELEADFPWSSLSVDEWDRFHGLTSAEIPFVFSRQAQIEFFDLLDSFDDDSITVAGKKYNVKPWLDSNPAGNSGDYWSHIYQTEAPGWEKGHESVVLPSALSQLKLSRSRVLVLGCGSGHDAAYFAKLGHTVTGVDFSHEAIARAKSQYSGRENLTFAQHDAFQLPTSWTGQFDLVFEHTCYCAITPERRGELVGVWRRVLHDQGHLLGVFFVMEKRQGPPFGGNEWELRQRLKRHFEALYWTRVRNSLEERKATELLIYAKKCSR